ncbi:MAG: hypothetical protein ACK559_24840, partial [bacterium]
GGVADRHGAGPAKVGSRRQARRRSPAGGGRREKPATRDRWMHGDSGPGEARSLHCDLHAPGWLPESPPGESKPRHFPYASITKRSHRPGS